MEPTSSSMYTTKHDLLSTIRTTQTLGDSTEHNHDACSFARTYSCKGCLSSLHLLSNPKHFTGVLGPNMSSIMTACFEFVARGYLSLGRCLPDRAVELSSDVAALTGELRRRRFRPRRDTLPFPRMASRRRTPAHAGYDGRAPSWGSGRRPTPARIWSSLDRIRRGRRWIRRGRP